MPRHILEQAPIVPVITIRDLDTAVPLAQALLKGGLPVLEITLRTSAGLAAISAIKRDVGQAIVGVGTVLTPADLDAAIAAGSEFVITPGLTDRLLAAGVASGVPFIPAIATVSELMRGMDAGLDTFKFFPAEANGGAKALKAIAGPFASVRFCPTGGIGLANLADYISLESVISVGGSWICPDALIAAGEWQQITDLAAVAVERVAQLRQA